MEMQLPSSPPRKRSLALPVNHIRAKVRASRQKKRAAAAQKISPHVLPDRQSEVDLESSFDSGRKTLAQLPRNHSFFSSDSSSEDGDPIDLLNVSEDEDFEVTVDVTPALTLLLSDDVRHLPAEILPVDLVIAASAKVSEAASALQDLCIEFNKRTALERCRELPFAAARDRQFSLDSAVQVALSNAASCCSFFSSLDRLEELAKLRQAVNTLHDAFTANTLEVVRKRSARAAKTKQIRNLPRKAVPKLEQTEEADLSLQSVEQIPPTSKIAGYKMALASECSPFPAIASLPAVEARKAEQVASDDVESDGAIRVLGARPFQSIQMSRLPLEVTRNSPVDVTTRIAPPSCEGELSGSESALSHELSDTESSASHTSTSASSYFHDGTDDEDLAYKTGLDPGSGLCGSFTMPFHDQAHQHTIKRNTNLPAIIVGRGPTLSPFELQHPISPKTATAKTFHREPRVTFAVADAIEGDDEDEGDESGKRCNPPSPSFERFRDRLASAPDVFLVNPARQIIGRHGDEVEVPEVSHRKGSLQTHHFLGQKPARPKRHVGRPSPSVSPSGSEADRHFRPPSPLSRRGTFGQPEYLAEISHLASDDEEREQELLIEAHKRHTNTPSSVGLPTIRAADEANHMPTLMTVYEGNQEAGHTVAISPAPRATTCTQHIAKMIRSATSDVMRSMNQAQTDGSVPGKLPSIIIRHTPDAFAIPGRTTSRDPGTNPAPSHRPSISKLPGGSRRRPSVIVGGQICDVLETPGAEVSNFTTLTPPPPTPYVFVQGTAFSNEATPTVSSELEQSGEKRANPVFRGELLAPKAHSAETKGKANMFFEEVADDKVAGGDGQVIEVGVRSRAELEESMRTGSADCTRPAWWKEQ